MWENLANQIAFWVITTVLTIVGGFIVKWINAKIAGIKDEKLQKILSGAKDIVFDGVKYTYQTYVEEIKGTTVWDKSAQATAMNKTVEYVKNTLTPKAKEYIIANYGDLEAWIKQQAEIQINNAKTKKESE